VATQGTTKILGGTAYKRYPDPASPGTANAQGLYPWSVFKAPLCDYAEPGAKPNPYEGLNAPVYLLLFTSDVPAILQVRTTDTGVLTGTSLQASSTAANTLSYPQLFTTPGGATSATITNQGQVLAGYTGPSADVFCTGFPAQGESLVPGGGGGAATYTEVICLSNSSVIASPGSSLSLAFDQAASSAFAPVPVMILYGSYTEAIRDAGNIIKASDGSLYQVVGLWTS
jgi:hypothetical protein